MKLSIVYLLTMIVVSPAWGMIKEKSMHEHYANYMANLDSLATLNELTASVSDAFLQELQHERAQTASILDASEQTAEQLMLEGLSNIAKCSVNVPISSKVDETTAVSYHKTFDRCEHNMPTGLLEKIYWVKQQGQWKIDVIQRTQYIPAPMLEAVNNKTM